MREAMARAEVGDDVFGDDPTVNALQERVASLLGKEAALFVPSGTMANQVALRAQSSHGDEIILHREAHIFEHESGATAALAGLSMRTFDTPDGTLPEEIEPHLHLSDDPHMAPTTIVAWENTQNGCGGVVVPQSNIEAVTSRARGAANNAGRTIRFHLDGARLMNAAVRSGQSAAELASPFDTVSLCLSKGLGAPVGSLVAGDAKSIGRAWRFRKMYGGGMRQVGILAAAGLYALDHHVDRLAEDHRRARRLAEALARHPDVHIDLERVHTNLVYFSLAPDHPLAAHGADGVPALVGRLAERGVQITGDATRMRAVTHLDVDDDAIERAIGLFIDVLARI
jgi:threonine aldolase